jgi:guanylate kinase
MRRGRLFVITAPSGAGKSSLIQALLKDDASLKLSTSYTTRPPRPGEKNGREYHFVAEPEFLAMRSRGEFLENAEVHGYRYGTAKRVIVEALERGHDLLLEIDWQGAAQVRLLYPESIGIFILPPSMAELERRLHTRAEDSDEVIGKRMARSLDEIGHWEEYDYVLVNALLEQTLAQIKQILAAERLKRHRQMWLKLHVERLKKGI